MNHLLVAGAMRVVVVVLLHDHGMYSIHNQENSLMQFLGWNISAKWSMDFRLWGHCQSHDIEKRFKVGHM